jgi:hypothetical protein
MTNKKEDTPDVPQLNTLPRTFVPAVDHGTQYRYPVSDLEPGGFLGGRKDIDEDEIVELAKVNGALPEQQELPEFELLDASFPGSAAAVHYFANPSVDALPAVTVDGPTSTKAAGDAPAPPKPTDK